MEGNSSCGIFGQLEEASTSGNGQQLMEQGFKQEIEKGDAYILSDISGEIKKYDIKILDIDYEATDSNKLDIRLGGYFDEEVLSGSQGTGFAERNEIFPHMTSSNCSYCTNEFVNAIKQFNMTYDVSDLDKVKPCPHCYSLWQDTKKIRDSRSIFDRVKDVLGKE